MIALFSCLFINTNTISKFIIQIIALSPNQSLVSNQLRYLAVGQMALKILTYACFSEWRPQPRPYYKAGVEDAT